MSDSSEPEDEQSRLLEAVKGVPTTRELPAPVRSAQYSSARAAGGQELAVSEDVQTYLSKKLSEYIERTYEGIEHLWKTPLEMTGDLGGVKLLEASLLPVQTDQPPLIQPQVRRRRRHSSTTSSDSGEDVRLKEAAVDAQDILGKGKKKKAVSANE
ncbi:hypothetical protein EMCRGX_G034382 [Ephydatia muelleri]|eukprot:Em0023g316a